VSSRPRAFLAAALLLPAAFGQAALPRAEQRPAAERRTPVVAAVERTRSAVVNVSAEELVRYRVPSRSGDPLADIFGDFFERPRYRQGYAVTSLGSGVLVSPEGYALTNAHVVERGARFRVGLLDGRELPAKVVGTDPATDIAVLKIESPGKLPFLAPGRSDDLMIGETVVAIGNPFGLAHTVTTGVISATRRNVDSGDRSLFDVVQTDASINPGNSGGPLINIQGQLVGINTAILGERSAGIGFAVPIDRAVRVAEDLIRHGEVREGWIGLSVTDRPAPGSDVINDRRVRVAITEVEAGSPAQAAGARKGDVVESVDGQPVGSAAEYRFRVRDVPIGGQARLGVLRDKARLAVTVKAVELSLERVDALVLRRTGLELGERRTGGKVVVVVRAVRRGGPASRMGVESGDLVREVNSREVSTLPEFRRAALRAQRSGRLVLLVQRGYLAERLAFDFE
jgi:S1-C subfamily serine protease